MNSNESFNADRGFHVAVVFVAVPARVQVEVNNAILDVDAWIDRTRKSNASSPLTTEMLYAVLALLSPCERTATKVKARTGFVNRTI